MKTKVNGLTDKAKTKAQKAVIWGMGVLAAAATPIIAFADVSSSTLATGTQALVSDLTTWLMILAPTVTVLMVVYYLIRKTTSDEMDAKKWNSRITVALVSCIGAVLASVIVNLLVGYYQ